MMTELESAERGARTVRYAANVRHEERKRAWDIIEVAAYGKSDEVAAILWDVAAKIMESK